MDLQSLHFIQQNIEATKYYKSIGSILHVQIMEQCLAYIENMTKRGWCTYPRESTLLELAWDGKDKKYANF